MMPFLDAADEDENSFLIRLHLNHRYQQLFTARNFEFVIIFYSI